MPAMIPITVETFTTIKTTTEGLFMLISSQCAFLAALVSLCVFMCTLFYKLTRVDTCRCGHPVDNHNNTTGCTHKDKMIIKTQGVRDVISPVYKPIRGKRTNTYEGSLPPAVDGKIITGTTRFEIGIGGEKKIVEANNLFVEKTGKNEYIENYVVGISKVEKITKMTYTLSTETAELECNCRMKRTREDPVGLVLVLSIILSISMIAVFAVMMLMIIMFEVQTALAVLILIIEATFFLSMFVITFMLFICGSC